MSAIHSEVSIPKTLGTDESPNDKFLSREACAALNLRVRSMITGGGEVYLGINSAWVGEIHWGRNRVVVAGDRRDVVLNLTRSIDGMGSFIVTNQTNDNSLRNALKQMEYLIETSGTQPIPNVINYPYVPHTFLPTQIWSDNTYNLAAERRSTIVRTLIEPAEKAGLLSAGYLNVSAVGNASLGEVNAANYYYPQTIAECSITVRDAKGTASGWAGRSSYDWARFEPETIAKIALDKCIKSQNPVRIEPGRYTAILEPQAMFQLVEKFFPVAPGRSAADTFFERAQQEGVSLPGRNRSQGDDAAVFQNGSRREMIDDIPITLADSRLGTRVFDTRISVGQDPSDPDLGTLPLLNADNPYRASTWVDHGVLVNMYTDRDYALDQWHENEGEPSNGAFKITFDGPLTTVEEMIASTKRGLLVTRFGSMGLVDTRSALYTGVTRDGLWLIENGKITKAAKNLRFTESPFFVLNNIEQVSASVPIFRPGLPALVPALKTRDFSFTSVSDAV